MEEMVKSQKSQIPTKYLGDPLLDCADAHPLQRPEDLSWSPCCRSRRWESIQRKEYFFPPEEQVACMEEFDQYIPPLWVMCLESMAHLLVMINFSTNFIIYCSVSAPFKKAFSKVKLLILCMAFSSNIGHFHKNFLIVDMKYCLLSEYRCFSERENLLIFPFPNTVSLSRLHICGQWDLQLFSPKTEM